MLANGSVKDQSVSRKRLDNVIEELDDMAAGVNGVTRLHLYAEDHGELADFSSLWLMSSIFPAACREGYTALGRRVAR
jgi:hypothetical protein